MLVVVAVALFVCWAVVAAVSAINYNRFCGGYLKLAADSNTVELAKENLTRSLAYIEDNELTEGNSSILWRVPKNDVGFWYRNLKSSLGELENLKPDSTQLEKTNVLMKLRETLVDNGDGGVHVTAPSYISWFPHQVGFAIWGWGSVGLAILGIVIIVVSSQDFWFLSWVLKSRRRTFVLRRDSFCLIFI